MTGTDFVRSPHRTGSESPGGPPGFRSLRGGFGGFFRWRNLVAIILALAFIYGAYFWLIRRVVVHQGQVLVLLKKNGSRSLPGDQVVIPRPPVDPSQYAQWEKTYGDCNGILEQVYLEGTYFSFSPWDYEREVIRIGDATIPSDKVGLVVKKFGEALPPGQVLADPAKNQRGPLPMVLMPGTRNNDYANPYAYEIKLVPPVQVDPGHRGVVTIMAGKPSASPNDYLVGQGEQGVQNATEPEGLRYVNLFEKRIKPVSIQSQRFEMKGDDIITFPSADSFDIRLEGFVEWSILPGELPLRYVQYGYGGDLIPYLEETVILPNARSFCRLIGSKYTARDFISGDTKLKFQAEFEATLRDECRKQGIEILQALVRDIVPPDAIKDPINEREIAKQQIKTLEQQIIVAKSQADFATQTEMANQNQAIGEANKDVVSIVKEAEQNQGVAVTKAHQELAVAKLQLQAAQQQADAIVAQGKADAAVILLQKQAEAEPLRQQVAAFGDGNAFAQYFFYQKLAPSVKSILTSTDGPFADLFKQLMAPVKSQPNSAAQKLTGVNNESH
ncbi:MAG TPA: SPFH domain-containing protein [Tepidisphaeraceae bacterium]|nr:SPFH domain-containing protein [Tepidisphaeraceae bacterium]